MKYFFLLIAVVVAFLPRIALSYPSEEVVWTAGSGPPFSIGVSATLSGFLLDGDDRLIMSYGEVIELVDLGTFAAEPTQPLPFSVDDNTDGIVMGIGLASAQSQLVISQDDGDVLFLNLSDVTAKPAILTITAGNKLGPVAIDSNGRYAYVADNTARTIQVIDITTQTVLSSVALTIPGVTTFNVTDAAFASSTGEAYFSTDAGAVFYIASGGTSATLIDIGVSVTPRLNLTAIAAFPSGSKLYVADATTPTVVKIDPALHSKSGSSIDITPNSAPTDIVITDVENPLGSYAYVAGGKGVTVINTASDLVFDLGTDPHKDREPMAMSSQAYVMAASSKTDGMVYAGFSTGGLGVISERPFAAVTSITYKDGAIVLNKGGYFTMKFIATNAGTYEVRSGGNVDASGTVLVDSTGAKSGTFSAADTEVSAQFNYSDNSSAFLEGLNYIWIFVTDSIGRGRRATTITVDTPPPNVVARSTGFGNGRVYINFDRLTVNDMASYNLYADTDPALVLTKTEVSASVSQPASGSEVAGEVGGLSNGTTYYLAVEGVDANGNKSEARTGTLADGSVASAVPELTSGPVGFSGEKGCEMAGQNKFSLLSSLALFPFLIVVIWRLRSRAKIDKSGVIPAWGRRESRANIVSVMLFLLSVIYSSVSFATESTTSIENNTAVEERNVPSTPSVVSQGKGEPWWSMEVKTGFWMPKSSALHGFFSNCCNMVTRIQGGFLAHRRYGAELGVGFFYKTGNALAAGSGTQSQDRYKFMLIPIELSFAWRADYFDWRYLVPYLKTGFDGWVFRESVAGSSTKGIKFGVHGVGGVQVNIGIIDAVDRAFDDIGIDEFFLTLETQYQWINNFGAKGLDLTGPIFSAGLLFEF